MVVVVVMAWEVYKFCIFSFFTFILGLDRILCDVLKHVAASYMLFSHKCLLSFYPLTFIHYAAQKAPDCEY